VTKEEAIAHMRKIIADSKGPPMASGQPPARRRGFNPREEARRQAAEARRRREAVQDDSPAEVPTGTDGP